MRTRIGRSTRTPSRAAPAAGREVLRSKTRSPHNENAARRHVGARLRQGGWSRSRRSYRRFMRRSSTAGCRTDFGARWLTRRSHRTGPMKPCHAARRLGLIVERRQALPTAGRRIFGTALPSRTTLVECESSRRCRQPFGDAPATLTAPPRPTTPALRSLDGGRRARRVAATRRRPELANHGASSMGYLF